MNIRDYWRGVRQVQDSLPDTEVVVVVSLQNAERGTTAGRVSECDRDTAARLIFAKTHRPAEAGEVEAFRAEQAEKKRQILKAEYDRKQQFALPEELAALVKAAIGQQEKRRG